MFGKPARLALGKNKFLTNVHIKNTSTSFHELGGESCRGQNGSGQTVRGGLIVSGAAVLDCDGIHVMKLSFENDISST